ncbi:branched-chain amino acid ABC transporter permease [Desulfovibrio sulfodismutans]|uniref:Branched-chain amino acid ABC transporter permease n=1 Tax=Desulfolutivibrio sulfodismutans TaxID=63561 RepID=A0A7K3NPX1_9BACT|nr:branched-chain amino acid ABC transporter permease [Desulfolutivibrio sulfodismutans]NDY58228.1 branched-chain amino acid ABC transporter permease [Desulfolutivibrio sulfodismutans]QLA12810.1 branched-chain amino acid ABC transporter permease [Desulfolutivibrio sulfodismutans DSM 3696]
MEYYLQLFISGLVVGSIYSLVALGFVIIYKATKVVNFAQGELVMVGAYVCFALTVQAHLPFLVAFFMTLAFSFILGIVIERLILRPMIGEPIISVIMVTIGLSSVLKSLVQLFWGTQIQVFPPVLPQEPVMIAGLPVAPVYLAAFALSVILFLIFSAFFKYSRLGISMRATAFDQQAAASMGIGIKNIFALSWCIAAMVSSIGGVILGNINGINAQLGHLGLKVFPAVILGGLDSLFGAALGGLIVGVLENVCDGAAKEFFGLGGFKDVAAFILLVVILMIKPYGLFGAREIERV